MKTFIYTIKTFRRNVNGNQKKQISLWLIKKNIPVWLGSRDFYHESVPQALASAAYDLGGIKRTEVEYGTFTRLENEGIARFYDVTHEA